MNLFILVKIVEEITKQKHAYGYGLNFVNNSNRCSSNLSNIQNINILDFSLGGKKKKLVCT